MAKNLVLGIGGASVVLGIALLVCGSIVIDEIQPALDLCQSAGVTCEIVNFWVAAGCFGIIAGLIQIFSFALVYMDRTKIWCGVHIFLCILCITSFGIAVAKDGFHSRAMSKYKAFTAISLLDMLFTPVAAFGMFYMSKSN